MIDLHTHILPGIDDGVRTLAESVELARAAAADGVTVLAATPHVRGDYPTSAGQMERLVAQVREAVARAGVAVDVRPGGEVALVQLARLEDGELRRFGLGGNPGYLLVECPYAGWPLDIADRLFALRAAGIVPVLAHPERNPDVQAASELLAPLVESGALVQLTAASLDGRLGRPACATALRLVELGLAHLIASDAHGPDVRAVGLSAAAEAVGDPALARWLTEDLPGAIVAGKPLPSRPLRRNGWLRRIALFE